MSDRSLGKFSVLVVDGDAFMAGITTSALAAFELGRVTELHSVDKAIDHLRTESVHCVILDLDNGAENKFELVDYIRGNPASANPQVPIVLCTAETELENICLARDHGVSEILAKPFSTGELLAKLTAALYRVRSFVADENYHGPDRRRRSVHWDGPERRGKYGLAQDQIDQVMEEGRDGKGQDSE